MTGDVRFSLEVGPRLKRFVESRWTDQRGVDVAKIMDRAIIDGRQFERTWKSRLTSWRPLNEDYVRWKIHRGYSHEIWMMTGRTMKSVTSHVTSWTSGGGRALHRQVNIVENKPGRVSVEWSILEPAAGGWFAFHNAFRPWVAQAYRDIIAAGSRNLVQYFVEWVRGAGRR